LAPQRRRSSTDQAYMSLRALGWRSPRVASASPLG
jgi:hypothetical protein